MKILDLVQFDLFDGRQYDICQSCLSCIDGHLGHSADCVFEDDKKSVRIIRLPKV